MRLYNLDNRSQKELKNLLDTVKSHLSLSFEEKTANIEAINIKLNGFSKQRLDILKEIEAGSADTDDIMRGGF